MLDVLALVLVIPTQGAQPPDIVGAWQGTSVCTRIPENTACHDETVVYDFRPSASKPGVVTLDAGKIVNGVVQPMGELDFTFDAMHQRWSAEFRSTRTHIRWSFMVGDDTMTGTCVLLPSETVVRNVSVKRAPRKSR